MGQVKRASSLVDLSLGSVRNARVTGKLRDVIHFYRGVEPVLSRLAAVRFSHFLPSLLLLLGGVLLARLAVLSEFFTSLFNVLPTLLLLLGGAFCLVYGRQREVFLLQAERREEGMRDQQLLAVATQAAGAAHELGTPLATMSVLIKELRQEHQNPLLQEDLAVLQEQVQLCKQSLQQLVRAAEADRRQAVHEQTAREWLESVLRRWHLMRPEASYRFQVLGLGTSPRLMPPTDLTQALLNLLNNAADACPDNLDITLNWDAQWTRLSIRDHGAGVPLAIAEQLGRPFFTTKGKGFGLGLFLSQASVTRAGGTLTELRLPRAFGAGFGPI